MEYNVVFNTSEEKLKLIDKLLIQFVSLVLLLVLIERHCGSLCLIFRQLK